MKRRIIAIIKNNILLTSDLNSHWNVHAKIRFCEKTLNFLITIFVTYDLWLLKTRLLFICRADCFQGFLNSMYFWVFSLFEIIKKSKWKCSSNLLIIRFIILFTHWLNMPKKSYDKSSKVKTCVSCFFVTNKIICLFLHAKSEQIFLFW